MTQPKHDLQTDWEDTINTIEISPTKLNIVKKESTNNLKRSEEMGDFYKK